MSSPILVTGATGFIGRELAARLVEHGQAVRALALPGEDVSGLPPQVEIVRGDVTRPSSVGDAVRGARAVVHLAAVVGDWGDESLFERITVGGTRNMLAAADAADVEHFIHISSVVCYADRIGQGPCPEETPHGRPLGPYSRTKQASERLVTDSISTGFPATVIRPGNVYGPRSAYWVVEPAEYLAKGLAMLIDGGRGDAGLVAVTNVVRLIELSLQKRESSIGEIFNASDGQGVTWREHFDFLADLVGAAPVSRSLPYLVAAASARVMEALYKAARIRKRPMLTRELLNLIGHANVFPNRKARERLGYEPISYAQECQRIAEWWGLEKTAGRG